MSILTYTDLKELVQQGVTEYQSGGALLFDDDSHDHDNPGWSDPLEAQP